MLAFLEHGGHVDKMDLVPALGLVGVVDGVLDDAVELPHEIAELLAQLLCFQWTILFQGPIRQWLILSRVRVN